MSSFQLSTIPFILTGFYNSSAWQMLENMKKQPPEVFYKKGVVKNFENLTRKHMYQSPFFNKLAGLKPATLLKKDVLL